jgi:hypothetical protein
VTLQVLGGTSEFGLAVSDGVSHTSLVSGVPLTIGEWHHVAATLSGANAVLYLDGQAVNAQPGCAVPRPVVRTLNALGRQSGAASLDALLDDVRLWNVARSAAQIQAAFTRPLAGSEAGLLACWCLDEGQGLLTRDAGPGARHGTLSGAVAWTTSTVPWSLPLVTVSDSVFTYQSIWGGMPGQFGPNAFSLFGHPGQYLVGFHQLYFVRPIIPYSRAAFTALLGQQLAFGRLHLPIATQSLEPGDRFAAEVRLFTTTETNLTTANLAVLATASDDAAACPVLGTAVFEAGMEALTVVFTESGLAALTAAVHGSQPTLALAFREFLPNDPPPGPTEPDDSVQLGAPGALRLELSGVPKPPRLVTNLNDHGPGSLRDEIAAAAPGDTLEFTVTGLLRLTNGPLVINQSLAVRGPGADALAISGNHLSRVLEVGAGAVVLLSGVTLEDGQAPHGPAYTGAAGGAGGGVLNAGLLELRHCLLRRHRAGNGAMGMSDYIGHTGGTGGDGGGIANLATLTLVACQFEDNAAGQGGEGGSGVGGGLGGVGGSGGAVHSTGGLSVSACTFTRNGSGSGGKGGHGGRSPGTPGGPGGAGGAIFSGGAASVTNCTLSGNWTGRGGDGSDASGYMGWAGNGGDGGAGGYGGGLASQGTLLLTSATIVSNRTATGGVGGAGAAGGVAGATGPVGAAGGMWIGGPPATAQVGGSIFVGNTGSATSPEVGGTLFSAGSNLVGDPTGSTGFRVPVDLFAVDPLLGPLMDNGGPTLTHVLLPGSPAINAGAITGNPTSDQRGFPRVVCTLADIGAVESQACPPPEFLRITREAPGRLRLEGRGAPRLAYGVETSADFAQWSLRATFVAGPDGLFTGIHLIEPGEPRLYFRLVQP